MTLAEIASALAVICAEKDLKAKALLMAGLAKSKC